MGGLAISTFNFAMVPLFVPERNEKLILGGKTDLNSPSYLPAGEEQIENLEAKVQLIGFLLIKIQTDNHLRNQSLVQVLD